MFIPLGVYLKARNIFDCATASDDAKKYVSKRGRKINYESIAAGDLREIRHVFARIVFDTVYPLRLVQQRP